MRQDEVVNPWAVCHAQLGKKKTKKFERCVMKVKAKHGIKENSHLDEQADYIAWILSEEGEAQRQSDHTEYEGPSLAETKNWIQKAINPDHEGYCTPMTKETCTPARKAFAKRAKRGDI
jgi:hypothetical protein